MWYPALPLHPWFLTDSPPEPVFVLLNVFSCIQDKHSRVHVFVCFLYAVVHVIFLPHTNEHGWDRPVLFGEGVIGYRERLVIL